MRSGAHTLVLLAAPLNAAILRALSDGQKQQTELRHLTGAPAQTTLRAQLRKLVDSGAIEKRRRNRFPGVLEYELTSAGRDLFFVADVLERWLGEAPHGPLQLGESTAKGTIKAFTEGWSTTMLRALAARPLSLTELDGIIASLSYPSLERRLAALRVGHLVETRPGNGRGTPHAVTDWLRHGITPLAAAAHWERRHRRHRTAPFGRIDIEAVFLLAMPLMDLDRDVSGCCRMAAEISGGNGRRLAGVMAEVEDGRITSCVTRLQGTPSAWILGTPTAWLGAVIEREVEQLELGGDCKLARILLNGMHRTLFCHERSI